MQIINAVLFEPVGCLAEFPAGPFVEIAARLFGRKKKPTQSGSRAYWHLLNLMESSDKELDQGEGRFVESLELQAVEAAAIYEDVVPAISELKNLGVGLLIASSLSSAAITRFLERYRLTQFFSAISNRESAAGIKSAPISRAICGASLAPEQAIFLTDTLEGLKASKAAGAQSILMMNDPDEARRLAAHSPAGGVVSLHELPDLIRLVAAENAAR